MSSCNNGPQLTVDVNACYPEELAAPEAPPPSRVVSFEEEMPLEAPSAPKPPMRFVSFLLLPEPLKVTRRGAGYDVLNKGVSLLTDDTIDGELAMRILADLDLKGGGVVDVKDLEDDPAGVEAFKKHLQCVKNGHVCGKFLATMGKLVPGASPPPRFIAGVHTPPSVPSASDAGDPAVGSPSYSPSPSYEPTSPPPESWIKHLKEQLEKERAKVREAGEAYVRIERLLAHEKVTAGLLREEHFEQLVAYAKAAAKPAPLAGRKRPASAMW